MPVKLKSGNGPVLRAGQKSDLNGALPFHDVVSVQVTSGTVSEEPIKDANWTVHDGGTSYEGGQIKTNGPATIISLTPEIAEVSSGGDIIRNSSGVAKFLIKYQQVTLPLTIDLQNIGPHTYKTFLSTIAGLMADYLSQQVDNRINSTMSMAENGLVYTTQNHTTANYVRNPNLWCGDVDLTCISPWNSNGGVRKAGTLITPINFIGVAHYELNIGDVVRFVAPDGAVHDRMIKGKKRHPDYTGFAAYWYDLTVYTLSSELPSTVAPCKLADRNWNNYLVYNYLNRPASLGLDQEEKALIQDFRGGGDFRVPTDADRLIFHEDKIPGDSGNPAFFIINGELVLVTCWTFGGGGGGTAVGDNIDDINQMIVDADTQAGVSSVADATWPNAAGHYQVKEADFSQQPNFDTNNFVYCDDGGEKSAWIDLATIGGDSGTYRYTHADGDIEEAAYDGSDWILSLNGVPTGETGIGGGADITAATFDNGYTFSTP